ncbi:hypothetical protein [Shouchella shacheensis]|nr:hypothetical protein [Shouchella shacheensis]
MNVLFKLLRLFGDAKSVKNGTYHKRLARRAVRRPAHRAINQLTRKLFK